jgi:serine/threonine-protein kinase
LSRYPDRGIVVFFLCCWIALGGSAWVDMMAWIGAADILDGARPACIGLGLFGIFQSMLLSRSHFSSLRESDDLNASLRNRLRDLEERQAEIEALNEELRQQVGRRSGHILAALAGVSASGASLGFEPNDVIEDRYRIIGALGTGGMGTVYEVERLHDRRRLALKVALETEGLALARLAREAQLATRVRHPNVVSVVDTDVAKDGFVYLVMELVEGCSLAERDDGRDIRWCLKVLLQILEGLGALHAQEIIHRDLKPDNVLLSGDIDRDPLVKITDFGISRAFTESPGPPPVRRPSSLESATVKLDVAMSPPPSDATVDDLKAGRTFERRGPSTSTPRLTRTGAISGTPSYIAPELARTSADLTPAVDVFSFGVVAYRILSGTAPHAEAPILARVDGREPTPHVPLTVAGLPLRVARLIEACLAFTPAGRPGTAELIRVLSEALEETARPHVEHSRD